jgi:hypothetical protein
MQDFLSILAAKLKICGGSGRAKFTGSCVVCATLQCLHLPHHFHYHLHTTKPILILTTFLGVQNKSFCLATLAAYSGAGHSFLPSPSLP